MEAVQRLTDVERSLETTEEECGKLRDDCESAHKELQSLALQHTEGLVRIQSLTSQLEEAERRSKELERRFSAEKSELEAKLAEMTRHESILTAKVTSYKIIFFIIISFLFQIETLQSDNDFGKEQMAAMKGNILLISLELIENFYFSVRLDQLQTPSSLRDAEDEAVSINDERYRSGASSTNVVMQQQQRNISDEPGVDDSDRLSELSKNLKSTQTELETCRQQLRDSNAELVESKQRVDQLNGNFLVFKKF